MWGVLIVHHSLLEPPTHLCRKSFGGKLTFEFCKRVVASVCEVSFFFAFRVKAFFRLAAFGFRI